MGKEQKKATPANEPVAENLESLTASEFFEPLEQAIQARMQKHGVSPLLVGALSDKDDSYKPENQGHYQTHSSQLQFFLLGSGFVGLLLLLYPFLFFSITKCGCGSRHFHTALHGSRKAVSHG